MRALIASALVTMTAVAMLCTSAAQAAQPAAVVEEIAAQHGIEAWSTLAAGVTIKLKPGERLVLNYLASCQHETIIGGVVAIGPEQSVVTGGEVKRERDECAGGKALLTADQSKNSAVTVFRNVSLKKPTN
jgi:hypothetical protein